MRGRPRQAGILTEERDCPVCGTETEHRRYGHGHHRDGTPRYQWRCIPCHAARQLANYHARKAAV